MVIGRRWVTNEPDRRRTDAPDEFVTHDDRQAHLRWMAQFVCGRPKATDHYTVEELEKFGMVGLYRPGLVELDDAGVAG